MCGPDTSPNGVAQRVEAADQVAPRSRFMRTWPPAGRTNSVPEFGNLEDRPRYTWSMYAGALQPRSYNLRSLTCCWMTHNGSPHSCTRLATSFYSETKRRAHYPFRNPGSNPRTFDLAGGLRGRLTTLGPVAPAAAPTCILEENGAPRLNADNEPFPPMTFVDTEPAVRFGFRGDSTLLL